VTGGGRRRSAPFAPVARPCSHRRAPIFSSHRPWRRRLPRIASTAALACLRAPTTRYTRADGSGCSTARSIRRSGLTSITSHPAGAASASGFSIGSNARWYARPIAASPTPAPPSRKRRLSSERARFIRGAGSPTGFRRGFEQTEAPAGFRIVPRRCWQPAPGQFTLLPRSDKTTRHYQFHLSFGGGRYGACPSGICWTMAVS
jgi:hypothetical protein